MPAQLLLTKNVCLLFRFEARDIDGGDDRSREKHMHGHDVLTLFGLDMAPTRLRILVSTCCLQRRKIRKALSYALEYIVFRYSNIRSLRTLYRNENCIDFYRETPPLRSRFRTVAT